RDASSDGTSRPDSGTKHFPFGTKVYCLPPLWGDGYEKVAVIGRHRGSRRLVTIVIPSTRITNWRVQAVFKPQVIRLLREGYNGRRPGGWSRHEARALARSLRGREAEA